jgi:hypothetical protein
MIEKLLDRGYLLGDIASGRAMGFDPDGGVSIFWLSDGLRTQASKMIQEAQEEIHG